MLAQKCKICGARHHRWEPHQWPDDSNRSPDEIAKAEEFFGAIENPCRIILITPLKPEPVPVTFELADGAGTIGRGRA